MGKLTNFYISFATNQAVIYNPGQVISGSVTAELNEPLELKGKSNFLYKSECWNKLSLLFLPGL